jgi:hypothetical protein
VGCVCPSQPIMLQQVHKTPSNAGHPCPAHSPVSPQQLQRVVCDSVAGIRGESLGHGALQGGGRRAGIQGSCRVAHHKTGGLRGGAQGQGQGGLLDGGTIQPAEDCQGQPLSHPEASGSPACPPHSPTKPTRTWMDVAMSAILNWVAWKRERAAPNCSRLRVYSRAVSRQNWAPPTLHHRGQHSDVQ